MNPLRHAWLVVGYYLSWILFGLGGLALNLVCAPFLLLPRRERQRWMNASGVIIVTYKGFDQSLPSGVVYVANHPSVADATFLLARLPDTVCIFKPALMRSPFIAPAALLAGYVSGAAGVDGVRHAAARVASGCSLLVFPEGTRTDPGVSLNELKPGFTLIARRAHAPIRLIHVRSSPLMGRKDNPWWRVPPLPGRFEFTLGELIAPDNPMSNAALTQHVATALRA
jgi:1-acyl-sn-glycerol-3-phosphate acyltransferase